MFTKENLIDGAHAAIEKSDVKDKPTKATVGRAIDAAFDEILKALERGDVVLLPAVGRLTVRLRKATKATNPKTKEVIEVPAKKVVRFSASGKLKEKINKQKIAVAAPNTSW